MAAKTISKLHCQHGKNPKQCPVCVAFKKAFMIEFSPVSDALSTLIVGDKIRKVTGYRFDGEVRAVFTNRAGEMRVVCELVGKNGGGMLHIFNPSQLEKIK